MDNKKTNSTSNKKESKKNKGTEEFQKTIGVYLEKIAMQDPVFKLKFESPKKNIEDCITYILNTVQRSGNNGFADSEIFGMALHYYDEEKIDIGKPMSMKVVVNHKIELTPEEIEEAKQKAKDKIYEEVRESMIKKKTPKPKKETKEEAADKKLKSETFSAGSQASLF